MSAGPRHVTEPPYWRKCSTTHPEGIGAAYAIPNVCCPVIKVNHLYKVCDTAADFRSNSNYTFVMPDVQDQILQIIEGFEPSITASDISVATAADAAPSYSNQPLILSHLDIIGLVEALHPDYILQPHSFQTVLTDPSLNNSSATLQRSDVGSSETVSINPSCAGSFSTAKTVTVNGNPPAGHSKSEISMERLQTGDESNVGTPKAQTTSWSLPFPLQDICDKMKVFAKRGQNAVVSPQSHDWTLFEAFAGGLKLRLENDSEKSETSDSSWSTPIIGLHGIEMDPTQNKNIKEAFMLLLNPSGKSPSSDSGAASASARNAGDTLQALLEDALATHEAQCDYITAHQLWQALALYKELKASQSWHDLPSCISEALVNDFRTRLQRLNEQRKLCERILRPLDLQMRRQRADLTRLAEMRMALRVKMWYVSDVKNSSPYEDALLVTKALRAMANPKRGKQPASITSWARQRLRGVTAYDRADKQALETLSAAKDHGGTSKLADEQVEVTSRWLTKNSIENFCKGEERIHRFCYEVHKSVNRLAGLNMLESPVLWSSHLFRRERAAFDTRSGNSTMSTYPYTPITPPLSFNELKVISSPTIGQIASPFQKSPSVGARPPMDFSGGLHITSLPQSPIRDPAAQFARNPHPALSSKGFGHLSPPMTPLSPKLNEVYSATAPNRPELVSRPKSCFVEELRRHLLALILSDLGYLLWARGSETDVWVNRAAAQAQESTPREKHDDLEDPIPQSSPPPIDEPFAHVPGQEIPETDSVQEARPSKGNLDHVIPSNTKADCSKRFPYDEAYSALLQRMSLIHDPRAKLQMLCQLDDLVRSSVKDDHTPDSAKAPPLEHAELENKKSSEYRTTIPRTKASSLEEVIANCIERRAGTIGRTQKRKPPPLLFSRPSEEIPVGADEVVDKLRSIFCCNRLRPSTLFRDLQYIAAFISPSILDHTAQGKAFWDAGLAALALKEDLTSDTIRRATEVANYHIHAKNPAQFPDASKIPSSVANTSLRDAAQFWLITAKEGSPVAARELALFYLTHPDLLRRATMPFSKAKDVFASTSLVERSSTGVLDPLTFAVVLHWMDVAAGGGDHEAKEFLRANGALGRVTL